MSSAGSIPSFLLAVVETNDPPFSEGTLAVSRDDPARSRYVEHSKMIVKLMLTIPKRQQTKRAPDAACRQ